MTEKTPQPPPTNLLERGRELLAKLRKTRMGLEKFNKQAEADMWKELGGPQDKVARNTLNTVSKLKTENKPPGT